MTPYFGERRDECRKLLEQGRENTSIKKSQPRESNPQPPHYECGALPIEARLA